MIGNLLTLCAIVGCVVLFATIETIWNAWRRLNRDLAITDRHGDAEQSQSQHTAKRPEGRGICSIHDGGK